VLGDASAALGIINRRGLGRTRHIDTGLLWIQHTAAEKRLHYSKVLGTINPADLMTNYFTSEINEGHCARLGVHFSKGRAETAPPLSSMLEGKATWEMESDNVAVATTHNNGYEEDMEAKFQQVVNNLWYDKWKKVVKTKTGINNVSKYKEDGQGLSQPITMTGNGANRDALYEDAGATPHSPLPRMWGKSPGEIRQHDYDHHGHNTDDHNTTSNHSVSGTMAPDIITDGQGLTTTTTMSPTRRNAQPQVEQEEGRTRDVGGPRL
jgi:hypothetical protein